MVEGGPIKPQRREGRRERPGKAPGEMTMSIEWFESLPPRVFSLRASQCKGSESRNSSEIFSPAVFSALIASLRFKGRSRFGCGSVAPSLCGSLVRPSAE